MLTSPSRTDGHGHMDCGLNLAHDHCREVALRHTHTRD